MYFAGIAKQGEKQRKKREKNDFELGLNLAAPELPLQGGTL